MGTRQLRLLAPVSADSLRPFLGRLVQLVLTDGEVMRGTLQSVGPSALRLQVSARTPAREVSFSLLRELITDQDANQ